jgi:hypothetical protein
MTSLQVTRFEEADFYQLIEAINARIRNPLNAELLREEFETKWPMLVQKVDDAIKRAVHEEPADNAAPDARPPGDILEDVVSAIRDLRQDIAGTSSMRRDFINEASLLEDIERILHDQGVDSPTSVEVMSLDKDGTINISIIGNREELSLRRALVKIAQIPKYSLHVIHRPTRRPRIDIDAGPDSLVVSEENE